MSTIDRPGIVLLPDINVLCPPRPGPGGLPFDPGRMRTILDLGQGNSSSAQWFCATSMWTYAVDRRMEMMWDHYARFANGGTGIDLTVHYYGAVGREIMQRGFGTVGAPAGAMHVYSREYWSSIHLSGDHTEADWAPFLRDVLLIDPCGWVTWSKLEQCFRQHLATTLTDLTHLIIVRQADMEPDGFTAQTFRVKQFR